MDPRVVAAFLLACVTAGFAGCLSPNAGEMAYMDAQRTFHLDRDDLQEDGEERAIRVEEGDLEALPAPAREAWSRLPIEGNVTFVLSREQTEAYYEELMKWAERAGAEPRWRFLYRGVYYEQYGLAH